MLMGSILTGIVFVLRGVFESQTLLLILAFITGLTMAFIQVSSIPWLAENSKSFQRVHLFSIYSAVMTGASVIGNLFGGIFTDVFSLFLSPLMSIRVTLIIAGLFYFSSFIPILKFQENRVVKKEKKLPLKEKIQQQREGFKIILLFAIAQLIIGIGAGLVIPYLNLYFADRFMASNSIIGIIISLGQSCYSSRDDHRTNDG